MPAVMLGLLVSVSAAFAQEEKKKQVKDQGEYDIFTAATKETDPAKKLQLLQQWKEKYPETDYKEERQTLIVTTYQALQQGDNMWKAAEELLVINPKSVAAHYFLTSLAIPMNNTTPERLDGAEKAANGLIGMLPDMFKGKDKTNPEWMAMETLSRKTLGWIEMQRKNNEKAEQAFLDLLKYNPASGNVSAWLGTVMLNQKKPEKQIPALYHFARAANYEGADAVNDAGRNQLKAFVERNYVNYHGDKSGLDEFVATAKANPVPESYPVIKSKAQREQEDYERMLAENPLLAKWLGMRQGLETDPAFFDQMKDAALPTLKGKVISATPEARPKEIEVWAYTDGVSEIKLVLETAHGAKIEPGTEVEFEGCVAKSFTKEPFLLTCEQENAKVKGLPDAPKAAPRTKKAVGGKKGRKK